MEEVTTDVFSGDFPQVSYGNTLEEVEATILQVMERVFRDDDGILLSCVNGRTMKPYHVEEIKNRPQGLGTFAENSDFPREFKPVWVNYENAGGASASYLEALCTKWQATHDTHICELARQTFQALVMLWENASGIEHPLGAGGKGWLPKPYAGIRNVTGMHECSIDEYVDVTHGLHSYYSAIANEEEKHKIKEIIISFADWWYDHDYCGVYFGRAIYWKRLTWHAMAVAGFLYINSLAYSWNPSRKFQHGFDIWLENKNSLSSEIGTESAITSLERLVALRPDLTSLWYAAASQQVERLVKNFEKGNWYGGIWSPISTYGCGMVGFTAAHHMWPEAGYDKFARRLLERCPHREDFYHVRRGCRIADIPEKLSGDDYLNMYHYGPHTAWLRAYWHLILEKGIRT